MLLDGAKGVASIIFPHLGIKLGYFPSQIKIGNFSIAFYGLIIAIGMILGILICTSYAKKTNQCSDDYIDIAIAAIIFGIIGARLYYVLFSLDYYIANPDQIFNLRGGGLAIYGGVIAGFTTMFVFVRLKKLSFFRMADVCVPGLLIGQIMGRYGNFFNREAFGDYSNGFLSMMIDKSQVYSGYITEKIASNTVIYDGVEYISVHPTFLYESLWNIGVLIVLLIIHKYKRFDGQMFWSYLCFYGLGRCWIEGLRTDQLQIGNTGLAVSQLLSGCLILVGGLMIIRGLIKTKGQGPMVF